MFQTIASLFVIDVFLAQAYVSDVGISGRAQVFPRQYYNLELDSSATQGPATPLQSAYSTLSHQTLLSPFRSGAAPGPVRQYQSTQTKTRDQSPSAVYSYNTYTKPVSESHYQSGEDDEEFNEESFTKDLGGYRKYKDATSYDFEGPHQLESIHTESYQKEVPAFDVSEFAKHDSHSHEKAAEVHYHQHKHVHKHDHKQEHVHEHKQDHKHEHQHKHKSENHHEHKHQQQHKHEHHSEHKHSHHQDSKHDHHHNHKHSHHGEHKHEHHGQHKHDHHSEHKHEHHGEHKHEHHSEHKHNHHGSHKHNHHGDHKHEHKHHSGHHHHKH